MRILALVILIISYSAIAGLPHEFSLAIKDSESLELSEKYRIQAFLKDLKDELSYGVQFAVDKPYDLIFTTNSIDEINCENLDEHMSADESTIYFSQKLKQQIISFDIHKKVNGCVLKESLVAKIGQQLLTANNSYNLEEWPVTDIQKENLRTCKRARRNTRSLSERRAVMRYEPCVPYFRMDRKKKKMYSYIRRRNRITRNVPLLIDPTSLHSEGLGKYGLCDTNYTPTFSNSRGDRYKMLGYAFVYYAPGFSTSQFGHVGERFLFCKNDELISILYDYGPYKHNADYEYVAQELYPSFFKDLPEEYRESIQNTNFIRRVINPTIQNIVRDTNMHSLTDGSIQTRNYGFYQSRNNRDIMEMWLTTTEEQKKQAFQQANQLYKEQTDNLKNQLPLTEYKLFTENCTHALLDRLALFTDKKYIVSEVFGFNPVWLWEILKKRSADSMILYPSQRTIRKLNMLEEGKSLFWENVSFFSKASKGRRGNMSPAFLIYPEYYGFLKRAILYPVSGVINLLAGLVQTAIGILKIPLKLIKGEGLSHLSAAKNSVLFSLTEILAVRMRFPSPTQWTEEELDYLENIVPEQTPKVVPMIIKNLH